MCDKYEEWFNGKVVENDTKVMEELRRLYRLAITEEPNDVNLVCFCAPKRCHGDTIARFLNRHLSERNNQPRKR